MFRIEDNTIHLTRGDKAIIVFSIDDYKFEPTDVVRFAVYLEKKLNQPPLFEKIITNIPDEEGVEIVINTEDTQVVEMANKPIKCWFEIELNDNQTVLGYDEDGPKLLILYPEGADE